MYGWSLQYYANVCWEKRKRIRVDVPFQNVDDVRIIKFGLTATKYARAAIFFLSVWIFAFLNVFYRMISRFTIPLYVYDIHLYSICIYRRENKIWGEKIRFKRSSNFLPPPPLRKDVNEFTCKQKKKKLLFLFTFSFFFFLLALCFCHYYYLSVCHR